MPSRDHKEGAERIYRDQPAPGAIEKSLALLPARERSTARATHVEHAAEEIWQGEKGFEQDGVRVVFVARPVRDGNRVTFRLRAYRGKEEIPTGDGIFTIVNPPVMVPDGTWRRVEGLDIPNYQESPADALKTVLVGVLRART